MNILVLNGSPKGDMSVTMQFVRYAAHLATEHNFKILNISQKIAKIESSTFDDVIAAVEAADAIWWATPLYVCLVPAQYKRFIELIHERGAQAAFKEKPCATITTSIHFFDNVAQNYLHAVCDDLNMRHVARYSPDMYDLLQEQGQAELTRFTRLFFERINIRNPQVYAPLTPPALNYEPATAPVPVNAGARRIAIITDQQEGDANLKAMTDRLQQQLGCEIHNIRDIDIKGGCIGCIKCGFDYICSYEGKDGFIEFYNDVIKGSDILIFAGTIHDRFLSARWKMFFDRSFFNTHTPTLIGKQLAFLISGPLQQIPNLRDALSAYGEWQRANPAGIVSDECANSAALDAQLDGLGQSLIMYADEGYVAPPTFLGVGGQKIFRDDIYGRLRFVFQADHKFYEEHGYYDFPQDDLKAQKLNDMMMEMTRDPAAREQVRKMIKSEMVRPYQKVFLKFEK